jgi:hypothetical protein
MVINAEGIYYLLQMNFEGKNPLANYEESAAAQIRKLFQYNNTGDIIIQSKYDPLSDQIPAFENLVAHHGGIGGDQTLAFLMHPEKLVYEKAITDATDMHIQLKKWQKQLGLR